MSCNYNYFDVNEYDELDYKEIGTVAFPISDEIIISEGPPQDGESYLQQVRLEARNYPNVFIADPKKIKFKNNGNSNSNNNNNNDSMIDEGEEDDSFLDNLPEDYRNLIQRRDEKVNECPEEYIPTKEWENKVLNDFTETRTQFEETLKDISNNNKDLSELKSKLPFRADLQAWKLFCLGNKNRSGTLPSFDVLKLLDYLTKNSLFEANVDWIENDTINEHQSKWLYALLCTIEYPLSPEVSSALHELYVKALKCRLCIHSVEEPILPHLNIIITVISSYFNQGYHD
eukprot:TRINITY_DN1399_c0_g2_i1.p1 TRINITY_DN1399_c0_g2~~TRINITY_DN1399_c0_g2_i1.p1  ORF type:complete len:287 (+),score=79.55 TRINITY_DN1399_c0_g2_i1:79-939(+)